jgi:N,N-dimethylformamidase
MATNGRAFMRITAYADKWTVQQGDTIRFYVNCDGPASYNAQLVQLIHGDTNPSGPGFKEIELDAPVNGRRDGRKQVIHSGSYGWVADRRPLRVSSFTLQCWIWPTMPTKPEGYWRPEAQALVAKWSNGQGYGLFLNEDGVPELRVNGETLTSGAPARDHAWHFLAATFDADTGKATLYHEPQIRYALDPDIPPAEATFAAPPQHTDVPLVFAGHVDRLDSGPLGQSSVPQGVIIGGHYNGKLDSPRLCNRALTRLEIETMKLGARPELDERRGPGPTGDLSTTMVGSWDFSDGISTRQIADRGPYRLDADVINLPTRAMTGFNWRGVETNWQHAPQEYGAIHFHDDDLDDARWDVDFEFQVPENLRSAVYAVRLRSDEGDEDYVPFFVRPPLGVTTAKIAVIMSTIDYMAYANEHLAANAAGAELLVYRIPVMQAQNLFLSEHREYGGSIYDTHTDGSGLCLSSRLRPVLSLRPKYDHFLTQAPWQFPADLHLIDWLTEMGYEFDVIADEDISYDGLERIEGYNVLITGSHPSTRTPTTSTRSTPTRSAAGASCTWAPTASTGSTPSIPPTAVARSPRCAAASRASGPGAPTRASTTTSPTASSAGCGASSVATCTPSPAPACRARGSTSPPTSRAPRSPTTRAWHGRTRGSATTSGWATSASSAAARPEPSSTSSTRCWAPRRTRW